MVNTQLLDLVKQQLAEGSNKDAIQNNLVTSGRWALADINEAFSFLGIGQTAPIASVTPIPPSISGVTSSSDISSLPIPPPGLVPPIPLKYAGFWIRLVALMADSLIIIIPIGIIKFLFALIIPGIVGITGLFLPWIYFILMTHYKGATLGKMLVGITVKSDDLKNLSIGKIILRETVGRFVSGITLCIGYIMAGFTQKKQGLHDYISHSVVVYKDPTKPNHVGLIIGIIIAAILPALAIIGILSSIVLVSLSSAREKGKDARITASISSIRANAESYFMTNNSYSNARDCLTGMFLDSNMKEIIISLSSDNIMCVAENSTYAVSAELSSPGSNYCVDSVGYSGSGVAYDDGTKASCQADLGYAPQ